MKKFLSSAIALTLFASAGAAAAQPRDQDRSDRRVEAAREQLRDARQDNRRDEKAERRAERRYKVGRYQTPRGYQARQWRHGERLPASYRTSAYNVDYRRYALRAPPAGYHYVRVGNDVVLARNNDGLISQVIMQLFQ